ncbi:MAG: ribose-5-phosphate isomerase RpiA [Pseudomonadota bacterium]
MIDDDKRAAAEAAVSEIRDGMLVGIGSGSTVAFAIEAIGRRRAAEWPTALFFATSQATWRAASAADIPIGRFSAVARLDLTIDGVDEIDPQFRAIKGGGGALLREKIVAEASVRMVAIADSSKPVKQLGNAPVPVEILPFAQAFAEARLAALDSHPVLRMTAAGKAYRTNQGNLVLDCKFAAITNPEDLAREIEQIPGALAHGLFLREIDAAYVADAGIVTKMERQPL